MKEEDLKLAIIERLERDAQLEKMMALQLEVSAVLADPGHKLKPFIEEERAKVAAKMSAVEASEKVEEK